MSGAHKKFKGLRTHKSSSQLDQPFYLGTPCLYHAHSTSSGYASTMRSSLTHECLECSQSIRNGRFGLDVNRLATKHQKQALRFWSKVDIGEWDECWEWTADPIQNQLYHVWKRRELRNLFRHHPILVMMWVTWGDVGRLGSVSLCGQRRCCNPLHNLPAGLIENISTNDFDFDWLENERQLLLSQVREFTSNKNEVTSTQRDQLKMLTEPYEASTISPFEQAFIQTQKSLSDGTHSIYLE